ncbi:MAG: transposase, partial [Microcystis panniformis]
EDEDEEEGELADSYLGPTIVKTAQLQILPLSAAAFPKTCYLVIDRAAELITRPLKDFAELGKVPPQEIQQRTLPIFESHRIARRFSKRKEKVIKVPDGRLIEKAHAQLEAKGITRLLMDGRIYALE